MAEEIQFFNIFETIGELITNNIINPKNGTSTERWVYPEFPKKDSNLPQIVLKFGKLSYKFAANENLIHCETVGNNYIEYYAKRASCPLEIYVLTEKEHDAYKVIIDNKELYLYGEKLNAYITNQVKDLLFKSYINGFLASRFVSVNVSNIDFNFEANKNVWGSTIICDVEFYDYIVNEYKQGNLIKSYSINETISI